MLPAKGEVRRPNISFSSAEVTAMLAVDLSPWERCLMGSYLFGARIGELTGRRMDEIEMDEDGIGWITIHDQTSRKRARSSLKNGEAGVKPYP